MGSSASKREMLRFGNFELDVAASELRRDGAPVRLQPQPLRVLALLASSAGRVVGREEIRSEIWGDETFVDFDQGLNFCIRQIRAALGDDSETPRTSKRFPAGATASSRPWKCRFSRPWSHLPGK